LGSGGAAEPIDGLVTLRHDAGLDADTGPEMGRFSPIYPQEVVVEPSEKP
jgi:hypothetical protein